MAAKQGPNVLSCMHIRTNWIRLGSVTSIRLVRSGWLGSSLGSDRHLHSVAGAGRDAWRQQQHSHPVGCHAELVGQEAKRQRAARAQRRAVQVRVQAAAGEPARALRRHLFRDASPEVTGRTWPCLACNPKP
jgi:hypothetical protein